MKKHIFFVNAHPDDLIGAAGLAFILAEKPEYELHIVDFTRGERGLGHCGVSMDECAAMRTEEEIAACKMLGVKPFFLRETDGAFSSRRSISAERLESCGSRIALYDIWPMRTTPPLQDPPSVRRISSSA